MPDFGGDTGGAGDFDLIPTGTLLFGILELEGAKMSEGGGRYYPFTVTITDNQPHANRKVWGNIMDPFFPAGCEEATRLGAVGNSPEACNMGKAIIQRILEMNNGAHPDKEGSYFLNHIADLSGMNVAVRVKIKKGNDGYPDKNEVAAFLSPHEKLPGNKDFQKLQSGNHGVQTANANNGFGQPSQGQASPPAQSQQPPQGQFAPPPGTTTPPASQSNTGFSENPPQNTTSEGGTPDWMNAGNGANSG